MKMFLLGILIMYLILGVVAVIVSAYSGDDELIFKIISFPEYASFIIGRRIYKYLKYHNLKSIIYVSDEQKWYYCERKEFDTLRQEFNDKPENYNEIRKQLYDINKDDFKKFYNSKLHKDFRPVFEEALFSDRYVPKSIWSSMPKISYCYESIKSQNDTTYIEGLSDTYGNHQSN